MAVQKKAAEKTPASMLVRLEPKRWLPFHTYELSIMRGQIPILTDYGRAHLEISRLQIDFGSTTYGRSGSIERFLDKKIHEAVGAFLKPHQFMLVVCDTSEHSVRFTLQQIGTPLKELECSQHFETSVLTFERALQVQLPGEPSFLQEEALVA